MDLSISPLGDSAVLLRLGGQAISADTHRRVRAICARLDACELPAMTEYVPAFASVAVHYDPAQLPHPPYEHIRVVLHAVLADLRDDARPETRLVEIPVCYGGADGPDLEDVARQHGLESGEVVRLHTEPGYLVHMLGFAPGFPYLGGLSPRLATPRRPTPRTLVPAGSVGIGGAQTGIYPIASPGGWHLIGRTPLRLFTPHAPEPTLLRMGDRVRFRAITADEFAHLVAGP